MNAYMDRKGRAFLRHMGTWMTAPFTIVVLLLMKSVLAAEPGGPIGSITIYAGQPSDVYSIGFQETVSSDSGGGGGAGRVRFDSFEVLKAIDITSPKLFLDTAQGRFFPTVAVNINLSGPGGGAAGSASYFFENVLIAGEGPVVVAGSPVALEQITLLPATITITTTDAAGNTTSGCWNVAENRAC